MNLNIIFFGNPNFSVPVLNSVVKSKHKVSLVLTQIDKLSGRGLRRISPPAKLYSNIKKINCLQTEKLSIKDINLINPDIIIVVAYGMLLSNEIIGIPKYGCINLHPSLLPSYRGSAPIQNSIINGDKETGASIIRLNQGMDTGAILKKKRQMIFPWEKNNNLHNRLSNIGAILVNKILAHIENGQILSKKQSKSFVKYSHKIEKFLQIINWGETEEEIISRSKALYPWPVLRTYLKNKEIRILQCRSSRVYSKIKPGTIVALNKNGCFISTRRNILVVKKIQSPNSRILKCCLISAMQKTGLFEGIKLDH